jgi:hypothetical protein
MHLNSFGCGGVPRKLISRRVKIPHVLFTRIGAEADSGRVSLVRGNLKSLRRSSARSESEPEVGYAKRRPSLHLGKSDASMGPVYVAQNGKTIEG